MPERALPQGYVSPSNVLFKFLDTNGDQSGTINAIGNYSSTPTDFFIKPPANKIYRLSRMIILIVSPAVIASGQYGSIDALTNGIKVLFTNSETIELNKIPIKTHEDWGGICHDSQALNYGNVAGKAVSVRWSFFNSGEDFWLNGKSDCKFIIRLNDNFSSLVTHRFYIQGTQFDA